MVNFECFLNNYHMIIEVITMEHVNAVCAAFNDYGKKPWNDQLLSDAEDTINEFGNAYIGLAGISDANYLVFSNADDSDIVVPFCDVLFDKLSISPDALLDILMD